MRTRSKLLLAGFTAAITLAAAVSTASAGRLEVSDRDFRVEWSSLTFDPEIGDPITCAVSLLGSFHSRTVAKVVKALIGAITSAAVAGATCAEGSATVLTETLPWHVTYNGFNGRLPNITGVRVLLVGAAFRVQSNATCLARTDTAEPGGGIVNRSTTTGQATSLTADESFEIDIDTPGFLCDFAGDSRFSGTSQRIYSPDTGLLFISLI